MKELIRSTAIKKTFLRDKVETPVLRGIDFVLGEGEKVAITGASGAGKSTFLHILGTLESPTSGSLSYQGKDLLKMNEKELSRFRNEELGFVFQFHYLLPELNALENVMIPGWISGRGRQEMEEKAKKILDQVGLSHRLDHRPSELSGGELQRVAIARAVVLGPRLLLADEPTGNLDSENRERVFQILMELQKMTGVAIMLITHDLSLSKRMDRSIVMADGMLQPLP